MIKIGSKVRELRQKAGMSIAKLAQMSDVSQDYVFRIETGRTKNIGILKLEKIADALEVDLIELLKEPKAA